MEDGLPVDDLPVDTLSGRVDHAVQIDDVAQLQRR